MNQLRLVEVHILVSVYNVTGNWKKQSDTSAQESFISSVQSRYFGMKIPNKCLFSFELARTCATASLHTRLTMPSGTYWIQFNRSVRPPRYCLLLRYNIDILGSKYPIILNLCLIPKANPTYTVGTATIWGNCQLACAVCAHALCLGAHASIAHRYGAESTSDACRLRWLRSMHLHLEHTMTSFFLHSVFQHVACKRSWKLSLWMFRHLPAKLSWALPFCEYSGILLHNAHVTCHSLDVLHLVPL